MHWIYLQCAHLLHSEDFVFLHEKAFDSPPAVWKWNNPESNHQSKPLCIIGRLGLNHLLIWWQLFPENIWSHPNCTPAMQQQLYLYHNRQQSSQAWQPFWWTNNWFCCGQQIILKTNKHRVPHFLMKQHNFYSKMLAVSPFDFIILFIAEPTETRNKMQIFH